MQIADKKFLGTATKTLEKKIHLCSIWDCAKLKKLNKQLDKTSLSFNLQ